jgi:hypothetical protein
MEMTAEELKQLMIRWELNAAQLAKVLCLHRNRMSEYLGGVSRIPCSLAYSMEALELLPARERRRLFEKRLRRPTHGGAKG